MKKLIALTFLFLASVNIAQAAVAFDASSCSVSPCNGWNTSVSTYSFNHTISGSDGFLIVNVITYNFGSLVTVSSVKCNGTTMTKLDSITATLESNNQDTENWYMVNPPTGTCTIQVNLSGTSNYTSANANSYTGVDQTSPIDSHFVTQSTSASASFSISTTVGGSNEWLTGFAWSRGGIPSAGSGTTLRSTNPGVYIANADSNGTVSTGSQSLNFTSTSGTWPGGLVVAIKPVSTPATTVVTRILNYARWW